VSEKSKIPEGPKHEDWRIGDPVGASLEEVRRVREDIERRVRELLLEFHVLDASETLEESGDSAERGQRWRRRELKAFRIRPPVLPSPRP
jgi:hypothetical protein